MLRLTTERLLLRDFELDDWPALHAVESCPEVAQYQSFEPRMMKESRAYVAQAHDEAQQASRETYDLAIVLLRDNQLIGRCGLGTSGPNRSEGMLWYTLHPSYWGRGYATEAARAVADFGFGALRLHRIWADCDPANIASIRVLEKIGMRREGHFKENAWIKGAWVDSLIYAILDREWAGNLPGVSSTVVVPRIHPIR